MLLKWQGTIGTRRVNVITGKNRQAFAFHLLREVGSVLLIERTR